MSNIEIDLYRDWVAHLRNELSGFGYSVGSYGDEEVVHAFLNLLKRLISPVPRNILKSREFQCPDELRQGLSNVERTIAQGQDLTLYLSRLLRRPDYDDPLLNHWGIHHIHLGTEMESDGFVKRTGPVLFCRFDETNAYFINVLPHGSWAKQEMVGVLHRNWPDSIRQFRLNGVIGLARAVSDQDVQKLRKGNVNSMVEIEEGVVYAPMGGGFATSGISVDVVRHADYCIERLRSMQQAVIDNITEIAKDAENMGVALPKRPQFGLDVKGDEIYAIEINSMLAVRLGRL
jgi:hypothetical protein